MPSTHNNTDIIGKMDANGIDDLNVKHHHTRKISALQLPSPSLDFIGYTENKFDGKPQQMQQVCETIKAKRFIPEELVDIEVTWFYGNLGIDDMYFATETVETIAGHVMGLYAAKMSAYLKDSDVLHVHLEQELDDRALYILNSRPGISQVGQNNCEEKIDDRYLDKSRGLEAFRLETFRSSGTVSSSLKTQLRCYFVRKCEFPEDASYEKTSGVDLEIVKVSDKSFLKKATRSTLEVYEGVMKQVLSKEGPFIDLKDMGSKGEKRLIIGYRQGTTSRFFSAISHLYHYYGLYSTRKYVENFSNGVTIICVYLAQLTSPGLTNNPQHPPIDHSVWQVVREASLIYCLPQSPLQELFATGQLSVQEAMYGYAALVHAQHFLNRLGSEYAALTNILDVNDSHQADVLARLKKRLRQETFTREYILELVKNHPDLIRLLYVHFAAVHYLPHRRDVSQDIRSSLSFERLNIERVPETEELRERIRKSLMNEHERIVFESFLSFNLSILKTNFFKSTKVALSFRLSPDFLPKEEFPIKPFGVFLIIGSEFRGFHVRFSDIARGGIRIIRSRNREAYSINLRTLFDENYALASTQQRKNKDIPEGGSKGTILLNVDKQDRAEEAFTKYVDAILDLIITEGGIVDRYGKPEILFFGPDEGSADFMDMASQHARQRGAPFWSAFTTGKSPSLGGIPHDVYGMTTRSIHTFVTSIYSKLGLKEESVRKVQTGGPDGDLGSNEILLSKDITVAIIDGSGVLFDPSGIQREELVRLAKARQPISHFDTGRLGKGGFRVLIEENNVKLPSGEIVENGVAFRNTFHLHQLFSGDLFVPCGGRPEAVDISNVHLLIEPTPRFKYIVEGANLFFTQEARLALEKAGVIVFKDASANKGGVTSSSLEVLAALSLDDVQFKENMMTPNAPFYRSYVDQVHQVIERNAALEFECMWKVHQTTGKPFSVISDELSLGIVDLRSKLADSPDLWEDTQLRDCVMRRAVPKLILDLVPLDVLYKRVPEPYLRAIFAGYLASRFVYEYGVSGDQFAFYQFMKTLKCF